MTTADKLRHVMQRNQLTNADVAELACVHPKTVESWLASPEAASHRNMPPRQLRAITAMLPAFLAKRRSAQRAKKG